VREVDSHSHSTLVTLQAKPAQRVTANGTRRCLLFPLLDWQPAVSHGMSCSAWLCLLDCVARTCTSSRRVYGESRVGTRRLHTLYVMFTFCVLHASNFAAIIVDVECAVPCSRCTAYPDSIDGDGNRSSNDNDNNHNPSLPSSQHPCIRTALKPARMPPNLV
jgi:hypothetical protein